MHGRPGSGCTPTLRRFFDPDRYRIVLFDRRGCGRSVPHASDPATDLTVNTTQHLMADMELLRSHLEIKRWLLFGGSWGSTLALAYAEQNPEAVTEIVLGAVTTTRRSEIDWLYHSVGPLLPDAWQRFSSGSGQTTPGGDLVEADRRLLEHTDPALRYQAAKDWCDWEDAVNADHGERSPRFEDPRFRMAFARLVTHYFSHGAWLEEDQLIRDASLFPQSSVWICWEAPPA